MRFRTPCLTAAQQYFLLRNSPISVGYGGLRRENLHWTFDAAPTPLGRTYTIRIAYRERDRPDVRCIAPDLVALAGGRKLPHVYPGSPPKLCLYLPGSGEWTTSKAIARTIVPWTYEWLHYFEDWLATDVWSGGGHEPRADAA
jgi:hypothetical protein